MKLFKRKFDANGVEDRAAPYYVRFMVKGRVHLWSTKSNDAEYARKRAKQYRNAIIAEQYHLVDSMKSRSMVLTFEELFKQYEELPISVNRATRKKNIAGMKLLLDSAGLSEGDSVDRLAANIVIRFQQDGIRNNVPPSTLNSRLRAAKSLFSARALMGYDPQLPLKYVDDFKRVPSLREPENLIQLPPPEAIELAHKQLPAYPDVYRCFLMAGYLGMRAGELAAARWDWIADGVIRIGSEEFKTKSGRWRAVAIDPSILKLLEECGPKDPVYIAGPHPKKTATRRLSTMLRALGFDSRNPTHSLRRWAGSVVAQSQGIYAARNLLGHSTVKVTEHSYARMINLPAAIPLNLPSALVRPL